MATAIRAYLVTNAATKEQRLVQATHPSQARNFVARSQYSVDIVNAPEVIKLMSAGIKAEMAIDEAAAATPDMFAATQETSNVSE